MSTLTARAASTHRVHNAPVRPAAPVDASVRIGIIALAVTFVVAIVLGVVAAQPVVVIASGVVAVAIALFTVTSYVNALTSTK